MPNIDIKVESRLTEMMKIPPCLDLSLPKAKPLKIHLPTGTTLNAFTDMSKAVFENPELYKQIMAGIPRGQHGKPADLAGTVIYLCSRASDHVVGQVLRVDGGASIA